jgi:transposase
MTQGEGIAERASRVYAVDMNLQFPTRDEIHRAFQEGEEAIMELFVRVEQQVQALAEQVEAQTAALKAVQARLGKTSANSSKPPSSDGYAKPKRTTSLRESGQKPRGGQPGHRGETLMAVAVPDRTEIHSVVACEQCGAGLADVAVTAHDERQVFDLPAMRIEVTAHRVEIKTCPGCGAENRGTFPVGVTGPVQYGPGVKTWATYFQTEHFVPVARTAQIIEDLTGQRVAEATLMKAVSECAAAIAPATAAIQAQLQAAPVVRFDESGLRVQGQLQWLHVASTESLTHYTVHGQRGQAGMDAAGLLPGFTGRAVHDHWKSYFTYTECDHALCNAHHLRELKFIHQQYEQPWAPTLSHLLVEMKTAVETAQAAGQTALPAAVITGLEARYQVVLNDGYQHNPHPPPPTGKKKRGRPAQPPPLNLLDRLRDFQAETLAFLHDFQVPFDNNQAERDVRMIKVKQKVSGGFRTTEGAQPFAQIRGYLSTARKQAVSVFAVIRAALAGEPWIPAAPSP